MSKQYKRFEAHGLFMHRLAIASACLGKKKSENKSIPYNSARGGKKKCRDVRRLASMAAECVDLVNLDMAALQQRTVRCGSARQYWCQMLQRQKSCHIKHVPMEMSFCISLHRLARKQNDDFELFVSELLLINLTRVTRSVGLMGVG